MCNAGPFLSHEWNTYYPGYTGDPVLYTSMTLQFLLSHQMSSLPGSHQYLTVFKVQVRKFSRKVSYFPETSFVSWSCVKSKGKSPDPNKIKAVKSLQNTIQWQGILKFSRHLFLLQEIYTKDCQDCSPPLTPSYGEKCIMQIESRMRWSI